MPLLATTFSGKGVDVSLLLAFRSFDSVHDTVWISKDIIRVKVKLTPGTSVPRYTTVSALKACSSDFIGQYDVWILHILLDPTFSLPRT